MALAPRESVTAPVSWRPSQKVGPEAQRITLTMMAGEAAGAARRPVSDMSPVTADVGETLRRSATGRRRVTECDPTTTRRQGSTSPRPANPRTSRRRPRQTPGAAATAGPQHPLSSVTNIGVATCRFGRGDGPAFQDLNGIPGFAPTPVTILYPATRWRRGSPDRCRGAPIRPPARHRPLGAPVTGAGRSAPSAVRSAWTTPAEAEPALRLEQRALVEPRRDPHDRARP